MAATKEQLRRDVISELVWDARVHDAEIDVEVKDGAVILTGSVPSPFVRRAASEDAAAIPGVRSIEDRLTVRRPTANEMPTGDDLRATADKALRVSPDLDIRDLHVSARDGVVVLEGSVDAYWRKVRAEDIVLLNLAGVVDLENRLAVAPSTRPEDHEIGEHVVAALARHALVDPGRIHVQVKNGVVALSRTVPSWAARRAANNAALHTDGVVDVRNNVTVSP